MIEEFDESRAQVYPKEDKCRHCGMHIGWILHPMAEALALGVCEKPTCQEKEEKEVDGDVGS
jgi:hypothetical protein